MKFHILIASVLGIGYVGKGGGTIAALLYCIVWFIVDAGSASTHWQVLITMLIAILGTWSANEVDAIWGTDSSRVVVDEIVGMSVTLLFVPKNFWYLLVGLIAFRFFDIVKPLGVKKVERLPKGWGVMADDVLAGLYALAVIHLCILVAGNFS
jgi:phosphatidylglycerophosphatase A